MKLVEQQVQTFTQSLSSDSPAPGGGSASALMGAQGAALTAMVCALTVGKAKYAAHQALAEETRAKAEALRQRFLEVIDQDTEAFLTVSAAYAMPKATEEERLERSAAIQRGLALCTETPLLMMELSAQGLELTAALLGRFNENAASDLGVAAAALGACLRGAWLNVLINVGSLKDKALARHYQAQGEILLERALPLSEKVYQSITNILQPSF